jgi:hypothetical protein
MKSLRKEIKVFFEIKLFLIKHVHNQIKDYSIYTKYIFKFIINFKSNSYYAC